jgi:hypothetical protein
MTESTKAVVDAALELSHACAEVERVGQYIQRGVVPSSQFVAPRLQSAESARKKLDDAMTETMGADAPRPARIRPRG